MARLPLPTRIVPSSNQQQKAGGSPGLAFSFLLLAPATNMPSLLLLLQQPSSVQIILQVVFALGSAALVFSYLVDAAGVDLLAHQDIGNMAKVLSWFVNASPWIAGGFFYCGMCSHSQESQQGTPRGQLLLQRCQAKNGVKDPKMEQILSRDRKSRD
jgi:uncharacterized membrane protein YraQ (UPF0718 family)